MGMPSGPGPTVQRAILTSELLRLRLENGSTQSQAANALDWSLSKLIRIEGGAVGISTTDLRALVRFYGMSENDPAVAKLTLLAREGRQRGWWSLYRNELNQAYYDFIGYEAGASIIRHYGAQMIPGLLQIEDYAKALSTEFAESSAELEVIVEVRMERREQILERADPPELFAILDEAALHRQVGGQTDMAIMARQLRHLVEMLERPNITIEVIPFTMGAHFGMMGDFTVLEFADSRLGDILFLENARSADVIATDRDSRITDYKLAYANLRNLVLPASETAGFIEQIMGSMGRAPSPRSSTGGRRVSRAARESPAEGRPRPQQ
ncbi:helix-turn-helix transcriptional regulator [Actinocorallia longicatena]|uniref:Helix-turn-helix transcriptional regulator n=1 Tax=Actinocorallia longicatena TaxID=111803 RepID=A0ABP6Q2L5_9ACTN